MKKIAIVYWSGTGNTAQMAEAVAEGAGVAGAKTDLLTPSDFSPARVKDYDAIAFGCPAMGAEQLEDFEFEPLFLQCAPELNGKDIALFGSYGWGDGEWMRSWEKSCDDANINLFTESVICCEAPDDDALAACTAMGKALAE